MASDFSGCRKRHPSTAASGSVFARARARARANTHGYSLNQTLVYGSLSQTLGLSAQSLPSLTVHCAPDSLLISPAVTKVMSPLRGDITFARLD